ncbi:SDR family oxidoreductase [Mesorhizobium sp. M4B.F.Ca.ET.215.01.1.1]|uniref:SDR family NAD(P)-dependent oxidoreductase n=2 Tax=Mesorhizobium TaxID=68287 RepID=UPI000FCB2808|nr:MULTISPECIES: SDR family oxidoreductase [unclassified Mesorhizobium]RUW23918.1 SDR family oxidoreductase [Mesorhizobium sp. M4B.F.Ca.ET.013.02.1.1]RUW73159.1 SDR family oxidoreductase [Mesorhizobium sp. M4B.F.Ca.ET.049.02.1.2]RVD33954.1 SDR family oxidoreductase [Mesorhizobium sp. M4B.F.Ca.ET.019.03.1.1]TGQ18687.1 SDR family oxidoreductase [Mesorhizobium sp. M4B.F.Ca.ET.215.01.1.1]TGQ40346.1 SDR family oxidoreductase [Mesorhizobium sp. M4B.F.Ca.ET.214.01.1.1]
MSRRLEGRKALITGAATGMGRATAELFGRHGAEVIAFGHGDEVLDEAARASGGIAVRGDITVPGDIAFAIDACEGRLDIVVNAAGVMILDEPETLSDETWAKSFAVNVTGSMMVCRAALPLLKQRGGAIVNIASVGAFNASGQNAAYSASKAALVSYTRSLAFAHGPDGIRANAVAPGWVRTPMSVYEMEVAAAANGSTPEKEFAALTGRIALRRVAEPEEIASCCLFLASDEASFVTGAVLVADGGGRAPTQNRAV